MTPKRQTLDGLGTRSRARTYADSYVPKHGVRSQINDVIASPTAESPTAVWQIDSKAIEKAKSIINANSQKSTSPRPVKPLPESRKTVITDKIAGSAMEPKEVPLQKPINSIVRPKYQKPVQKLATKPRAQAVEAPTVVLSDIVKQIQRVEIARSDRLDEDGNFGQNRFILGVRQTWQNMIASKRSIALSAMSTLLLVGGTVALISSFTTNKVVGSQVKALSEKANAVVDESLGAVDSDGSVPSEEKVPEAVVNSYRPPADEPRYIYIPKIKNAKTRVLKMGVGKDGAVQTPRTTWDTGWFEGSSKPGEAVGAALIIGHVSGLTSGGVFYNLYRLADGDEIIVEMGDGTKYTYTVVAKEEVPLDGINMNNYLISKNIDKPGLTIMTCAGEYNPVTQTYDNRLAVFAVRQN